jgi:hypothetical protein
MLDEALRKLKLDRRLQGRRGWTTRSELGDALAALPDVSAKIAPVEEPHETPAGGAPPEEPGAGAR